MADPVSILASAAQIGQVCFGLVKFFHEAARGIQKIDEDLHRLSSDITSLKAIIDAIKGHFQAEIGTSAKRHDLEKHDQQAITNLWLSFGDKLTECRDTVVALDALCSKIGGRNTEHGDVIERSKRWMRKYTRDNDIVKFQQQISAHHESLQLLLIAANVVRTRNLQSTSEETITLIRSLRAELRKCIHSVQSGTNAKSEDLSPVLESAKAVMPLAFVNEHFSLPQAVSSVFRGRDRELDTLRNELFRQDKSSAPLQQKRFVVYGLGGAGKSQFCCKFAQDNRHRFWGVFWIDATSAESAKASFASIARIGKVDANERAAKAWLSSKDRPWLLIIDNADDPDVPVEQYFPEGERGVILITTRNFHLKTHGTVGKGCFHFTKLDSDASNHLLLHTAGEEAPWKPAAVEDAACICEKLGFLPLAIIHAGRAILARLCTLSNYLTYFEKSWSRVREARRHRRKLDPKMTITVFSSYELAFQGLRNKNNQTSEDAEELLKTFAFLHCQRIQVQTLIKAAINPWLEKEDAKKRPPAPKKKRAGWKSWPQMAKGAARMTVIILTRLGEVPVLPKVLRDVDSHGEFNEIRLREALSALHQMSLIDYDASDDSYSIHPLIHIWMRERPEMRLSEQAIWCQAAATILARAVLLPPLGSRESDETLRRDILPHVYQVRKQEIRIRDEISRNQLASQRWWRRLWTTFRGQLALGQVGQLAKFSLVYAQNGLWQEALKLQKTAADFLIQNLGKEHPVTIRLLLFMSEMYFAMSEADKASDLLEDLLQHCRNSCGEDDEDTVRVLNQLGNVRWQQARFMEARYMLDEVVIKLTQIHGATHPDTLRAMSSLGRAIGKVFDFEEALRLHKQALEGLESDPAFERTHTETLTVLDNLAMAHFDRYHYNTDVWSRDPKDLDIAHELEIEVIEGRKKLLGKEHGFTLWAILNLARIKAERGEDNDLQTAEEMIRKGLVIAERNLGETHLGVLYGKSQLGVVFMRAERFEEAESLLKNVVVDYEKSRGGHADHLVAMGLLLECYQKQENIEEAEALRDKVLQGTRKIFGPGSVWEDFMLRKFGEPTGDM